MGRHPGRPRTDPDGIRYCLVDVAQELSRREINLLIADLRELIEDRPRRAA